MVDINENFLSLGKSYLFQRIAEKKTAFLQKHPEADLLDLGIGDTTLAPPKVAIEALIRAGNQMLDSPIGYGPSTGYLFLKEAICNEYYKPLVSSSLSKTTSYAPSSDEVFISDGAKSDTALLENLFAKESKICVCDPVYPVYVDSNALAGRLDPGYENAIYAQCTEENGFTPKPPSSAKEPVADIIYLCSPHNPTGIAFSYEALKKWVDYALEHKSVIIFDAAYSAFVTDPSIPKSIYEVENAEKVAIECGSFSKGASFTGLRCAWCVIPQSVIRSGKSLNALWNQYKSITSNGVSYPIQKAAEALFTPEGKCAIEENAKSYMASAQKLHSGLKNLNWKVFEKPSAPYVWCKSPVPLSSWELFDLLLEKAHIIATPGSGFGKSGEGYIRFSAFAKPSAIDKALVRLSQLYQEA